MNNHVMLFVLNVLKNLDRFCFTGNMIIGF